MDTINVTRDAEGITTATGKGAGKLSYSPPVPPSPQAQPPMGGPPPAPDTTKMLPGQYSMADRNTFMDYALQGWWKHVFVGGLGFWLWFALVNAKWYEAAAIHWKLLIWLPTWLMILVGVVRLGIMAAAFIERISDWKVKRTRDKLQNQAIKAQAVRTLDRNPDGFMPAMFDGETYFDPNLGVGINLRTGKVHTVGGQVMHQVRKSTLIQLIVAPFNTLRNVFSEGGFMGLINRLENRIGGHDGTTD